MQLIENAIQTLHLLYKITVFAFFMFVLLQNDNFFNVELPTCQVLETWSLLLKANDEKVGSSLALQVSESRLRRTHEIYSFDVRPFMWRTPGVSCSPAYERCPTSAAERWEILTDIYRTPIWIPPEPQRGPEDASSDGMCFSGRAEAEPAAVEERWWMRVNVFSFSYDVFTSDLIDEPA